MLTILHENKKAQLVIGLVMGIIFGFLLHKGGATSYDVIIGQLLFKNMIVVKIMMSAVLVSMLGIYTLKSLGMAELHPKAGSIGTTVIGGLIFGAGFGILGYCPGTVIGAVGHGALDALFGGVIGILIGASIFAMLYPKLQNTILNKGSFGTKTLPEVFKVNPWVVVIPVAIMITGLLVGLEMVGL